MVVSKRELVEDIASGEKSVDALGIGTEHEKFIFGSTDFKRLPYRRAGGFGIYDLLERLRESMGWAAIMEGDNIIGLRGDSGDSITLEPGGQFELSGGIVGTIHETCQEVSRHLKQVSKVCNDLDAFALGMGFDPVSRREDVSWMPKSRYEIMGRYMPTKGSMGLDMMLRTCTVQVNLDFVSESDMVEKMRVAIALQPLCTALFANSPFCEGEFTGYSSYRSLSWFHTDDDRCGMLPFVFESGFGYERWVDYLLDVPMYFFYRDGVYHDVSGLSFRDFMDGRLRGYEGIYATLSDWRDHMTTAFPEVRLKQFIEMRGADGGSWCNLCALPAFWVGLLYDAESLSAVRSLVLDWSVSEMLLLRSMVARDGLSTEFRGGTLRDLALEVLSISAAGLSRRGCLDSFGSDESGYLRPLHEIVESGETLSASLLRSLGEEFGGDLHLLMRSRAY